MGRKTKAGYALERLVRPVAKLHRPTRQKGPCLLPCPLVRLCQLTDLRVHARADHDPAPGRAVKLIRLNSAGSSGLESSNCTTRPDLLSILAERKHRPAPR